MTFTDYRSAFSPTTTPISAKVNKKKTTVVTGTTDAQILVHTVLPSQSTDVELLSSALVKAYSQVHEDSTFHVTGVELERQVTVPDGGVQSDNNNNYSISLNGKNIAIGANYNEDDYLMAMYWVKIEWSCTGNGCRNDNLLPGLLLAQDYFDYSPNFHSVFEALFCNNLRSSTAEAFAEASACKITFSPGKK